MNITRRSFVRNTSFAVAGSTLFPHQLFAGFQKTKLTGIQLYSVRDQMKENPLATLQQIARMGYKNVEHASYNNRKFYGYAATEFKKILDDLGLKMVSGHTVMRGQHWDDSTKDFTSEWKYTVEDAAILGQKYVISPWLEDSLRKDYDALIKFMDLFNKSGELCKKSGMLYGYHNHDFEFNTMLNGKKLYDIILQNTDPQLVMQQLDIGNMHAGGAKAMDVIKQYPGRFKSMHVKDEIKVKGKTNEFESTVLGKGLIDVKKIIEQGRKTGGTEHFIIEQEAYQGQKPLDAVRTDLMVMKKWGY